jgi:hypothetical protein
MHDETRKKRSHISTDVFINRTISAEGLDLSVDGMYLYTRHQFIVGSIIEVTFSIEGTKIDVSAKVVHSQPGIGVGVKFTELHKDTADKIKSYLRRS